MKQNFIWRVVMVCLLFNSFKLFAQQVELKDFEKAQKEAIVEKKEAEPEDDTYEQDMEYFRTHPINLNTSGREELVLLQILNANQIENIISYRELLGALIDIHELQAIPDIDLATIKSLLPFVRVGVDEKIYSAVKNRLKKGNVNFLCRVSQVLEKSEGYKNADDSSSSGYLGSPRKIYLRYNYNYEQLLQYGFSGDKDAGEQFFRGAQKWGFDFYSFHFFLRRIGIIKGLALGDYTINMGQGLIHWQTTAFTKSNQTLAIKREAPLLRPYHSAGEYNFHRGVAINLEKGNWQALIFVSDQKISTNAILDTSRRDDLFSSIHEEGYHRTKSEIADRNNCTQITVGGSLRFENRKFISGFNFVNYQFSRSFQKRELPYNIYSMHGSRLSNYSFDYSYTYKNMHAFGEWATDQHLNMAVIQGLLVSLRENVDMSLLYRNISPRFISMYGDAFTENTVTSNEHGLYLGIHFRPTEDLQLDMYYDTYQFPWLKYQVNAPSGGKDFSFQLSYQPVKEWKLVSLYRNESKSYLPLRRRWRVTSENTVSRSIGFENIMELIWLGGSSGSEQHGFLGSANMHAKRKLLSGSIGLTMFETDNYDTRIYVYEPDMLYSYSVPSYFGKGIHYYINLHKDLSGIISGLTSRSRLSAWLKWAETVYSGQESIGSGLDMIRGNHRSEIKIQILLQWL